MLADGTTLATSCVMNQISPNLRHNKTTLFKLCAAALALYASSVQSQAATTAPEQLIGATQKFLEQAVTHYLENSEIDGRHEIKVADLDPRLRLPLCDEDLTTSLESPAQPIGRVTVRVSCKSQARWTVFVPAKVRLYRYTVILTNSLSRNSVISGQDVTLLERDVSRLKQGYLTDLSQAVGKKLTRSVLSGQVLLPTQMQEAEVIQKGDQVVINARTNTINVRMPGEALSKGAPGEQISVRNLHSKRVIRARVLGPGSVQVGM